MTRRREHAAARIRVCSAESKAVNGLARALCPPAFSLGQLQANRSLCKPRRAACRDRKGALPTCRRLQLPDHPPPCHVLLRISTADLPVAVSLTRSLWPVMGTASARMLRHTEHRVNVLCEYSWPLLCHLRSEPCAPEPRTGPSLTDRGSRVFACEAMPTCGPQAGLANSLHFKSA